ncbi:hypothetical protein NC652_009348 [Populus alba x Populus x berolinensis]|nr:hypothetical protein NC652_009348 [Populus alba x Populus x berolinensis]
MLLLPLQQRSSHVCLLVRKKGYASRIVVQRSTEEESLHIIKFWRDSDIQMDAKEISTTNKSVPARVMDPLVSQLPQLPFWRSLLTTLLITTLRCSICPHLHLISLVTFNHKNYLLLLEIIWQIKEWPRRQTKIQGACSAIERSLFHR